MGTFTAIVPGAYPGVAKMCLMLIAETDLRSDSDSHPSCMICDRKVTYIYMLHDRLDIVASASTSFFLVSASTLASSFSGLINKPVKIFYFKSYLSLHVEMHALIIWNICLRCC